jgi:hypothetical protein
MDLMPTIPEMPDLFAQIRGRETPRTSCRGLGKKSALVLVIVRRATIRSVHPTTDNDTTTWRDNDGSSDRACDNCTSRADAARPVYTAGAHDGACFHRAQGEDASCQQ